MIETELRTADMPAVDRFACWLDMTSRSLMPGAAQSAYEEDFRATVSTFDLGAVRVCRGAAPSFASSRTPKLIRRSDPETYLVSLILAGTWRLDHAGHNILLRPGEFVLYDSSRPWSGSGSGAMSDGRYERVIGRFPKALLPLPEGDIEPLVGARLPGRHGLGALLSHHLVEISQGDAGYDAADDARLATITLDLVAAMIAHERETEHALPYESQRRALQTRIHAFIQEHLGDPRLTPAAIAAAHQISLRHLQNLFQDQGLTVATWIRRSRLDRCRHDLADPRLRDRPIHAIATRWGFPDNAHFSRLFRATYGVTPSDYRHLAHRDVHEYGRLEVFRDQ